MYDEDNEFWSEREYSEDEKDEFLKETSPIDYYSKRIKNGEIKCICPNQELLTFANFCENCNSSIY